MQILFHTLHKQTRHCYGTYFGALKRNNTVEMFFHKKDIQIVALCVISRGLQKDNFLRNYLNQFHTHDKQSTFLLRIKIWTETVQTVAAYISRFWQISYVTLRIGSPTICYWQKLKMRQFNDDESVITEDDCFTRFNFLNYW